MLIGHIDHPKTYTPLLADPIWNTALTWLRSEAGNKTDGEYEIQGRNLYASVATINTLQPEEATFEAHKKYLDIHYCLESSELIGWAPVQTLTPKGVFQSEKDYGLYQSPQDYITIHQLPGIFSVYFPEDAHMPKMSDQKHRVVKKVVVKINLETLTYGK